MELYLVALILTVYGCGFLMGNAYGKWKERNNKWKITIKQ